MNSEIILNVDQIEKAFGNNGDRLLVLNKISFQIQKGEFMSIIGPSGCGKTTLLEILAKLQTPSAGKITVDNSFSANENSIHNTLSIIVFQQYNRSLFPFMTVASNINFSLDSIKTLSKKEKEKRLKESLAVTGLSKFSNYYPWQLSGGMQQRVAIARVLAVRPMILLLDEPFASLDTQTRYILEDELTSITQKYNLTVIYVTHDIDSAIYMGKRIILLSKLPAQILADIKIDLPYPRDQITTRAAPKFSEYREYLYNLLKQQIENHR
jgi:NitT/TauT family transport system ATP-binding protein